MPTVLRTFAELARVGHQETAWSAPIPETIQHLHVESVAADAVHEDLGNSMDFRIFVSPDGEDLNPLNKEVFLERWKGGTHQTKPNPPGTFVVNKLDITFGPMSGPNAEVDYVGWHVKIVVDIPVEMVIGGTVTSLP
jgi:hypothetical protein